MTTQASIDLRVSVKDTGVNSVGKPVHSAVWSVLEGFSDGTGLGNVDTIHCRPYTLSGSAEAIDLTGLTGEIADSNPGSMAGGVAGFGIRNKSTTSGYDVSVGAGSNPFLGWIGDATDLVTVPPGGCILWFAGKVDDIAPVATTGDILTVDPGANTIAVDVFIIGRSA